jgi:hypothetical protein
VEVPGTLTLAALADFSPELPLGDFTLVAYAVDAMGRTGGAETLPLQAVPAPAPMGQLVVALRWDTESDLDLHVVDAHGVEIWARNINSYQPPPGGAPDPNAWMQGGILDRDSNANCVIDGARAEDVIWTQTPPSGHYLVRVDTFSLCGESAARWTVEVTLRGAVLARAHGQSGDADTRGPHDRGAGLRALEFDVP